MSQVSPRTLKRPHWHSFQGEPVQAGRAVGAGVAQFVVPLLVIAILLWLRAFVMAGVVGGVSVVIWLVRAFSPAGRRGVDRAMLWLAHWAGQAVAVVLLAPAFYGVMTVIRLMNRLTGHDPLQLRGRDAPTFWLPSDLESRRLRHAKRMFCTERLVRGRFTLLPLAVLGVLLLVVAEAGLRLYGYGTPLLYVQDPDVGFYPKPDQRVRYPGRVITVNAQSMRAGELASPKAPGRLRILMLGDSTLAGTRVSNPELYSSLLEERLNAAAGKPAVEVLNLGVNAWGPFHMLAFVKKFGAFEADLAVICGPVWDLVRPLYGLERLPFFPATRPPRLALEHVAYELLWRYRERVLGPPAEQAILERMEAQCREGIGAYAELARLLQRHGAEVVFEMLPPASDTFGATTNALAQRLFGELAASLAGVGVAANCAGSVFRDAKPAARVYYDGVHFDRLGHRLYGAYLADRLRTASSRLKPVLARP